MATPNFGITEVPENTLDPAAGLNLALAEVDALMENKPGNFQTGSSYELVLGDMGRTVYIDNAAHTLNIPDNATVAAPIGSRVRIVNEDGSNAITVTDDASVTWRGKDLVSSGIAAGNQALIEKTGADEWMVLEYGAVPT